MAAYNNRHIHAFSTRWVAIIKKKVLKKKSHPLVLEGCNCSYTLSAPGVGNIFVRIIYMRPQKIKPR